MLWGVTEHESKITGEGYLLVPTIEDKLFTVRREGRVEASSLFDLFNYIVSGEAIELSRARAHQRAPIVTALALLITVLQRYSSAPLSSADDWRNEWERQIGRDATRATSSGVTRRTSARASRSATVTAVAVPPPTSTATASWKAASSTM